MDMIAEWSLETIGRYIVDFILCLAIVGGFGMAAVVVDSLVFDDDTPGNESRNEVLRRIQEAAKRYRHLKEQARIRMFGRGRKYEGEEISNPEPRALD